MSKNERLTILTSRDNHIGDMMQTCNSVEEVIKGLGGYRAVSEMTGRTQGAVRMWRNRDKFPPAMFEIMRENLKNRRFTAPKELWGMS